MPYKQKETKATYKSKKAEKLTAKKKKVATATYKSDKGKAVEVRKYYKLKDLKAKKK